MLRILSFNVLAQTWIDDEIRNHVKDQRHLKRQYRLAKQIKLLKHVDADVLFLQEVTPITLSKMQKELSNYEFPGCFCRMLWSSLSNNAPQNGNAIVFRKGVFSETRCHVLELDGERGNYASVVEAVHRLSGHRLKLVCVHLEYGDRDAAAQQFRRLLHTLSSDGHVIIGGDFNMGPPSWPIAQYFKLHTLQDACLGVARTHPFKDGPDDNAIDHVLLRGFEVLDCLVPQYASVNECIKEIGSDHFPVIVSVRFKKLPSKSH
jgi:endonuclease/exonuclease/phosphatase family metal-dependent hydrolase